MIRYFQFIFDLLLLFFNFIATSERQMTTFAISGKIL